MYMEPISRPSVRALVVANTVPLVGVLFFGWSLFAVMFLYWMENVVVGAFNVLRMYKARGFVEIIKPEHLWIRKAGKLGVIFFFILHYGIFTLVHGVFVYFLFGPFDMTPFMVLVGVSALTLSHAISYLINFIGNGEYERVHEAMLLSQPYKRVIVLHFSIIAGGFFVMVLGAPAIALAIFVLCKTCIDVVAHNKERALFSH